MSGPHVIKLWTLHLHSSVWSRQLGPPSQHAETQEFHGLISRSLILNIIDYTVAGIWLSLSCPLATKLDTQAHGIHKVYIHHAQNSLISVCLCLRLSENIKQDHDIFYLTVPYLKVYLISRQTHTHRDRQTEIQTHC